jgi:hypothetical protein
MAKSSAGNPPLVRVTWADAYGDKEDEVNLEGVGTLHSAEIMHTVGWLVHSDASGVSVCNEKYGARSTYRGRTFIPAAMVQEITPLSEKRKRRSPKKESALSSASDESTT